MENPGGVSVHHHCMGDDEPNSATNGLSGMVVVYVVVVSPTGLEGFCNGLDRSWDISFRGLVNAA